MKILAFDQATNITAWSVWENGQPVRYGCFDLKKQKDVIPRTDNMSQLILDLIGEEKPTMIVIEDVSYQRNVQSLIDLARLQGRIMQMAYEDGLPVNIYKPSSWRKSVGIKTGKGIKQAELKAAAVELVKERYQADVTTDVAEAICIGECAWRNLKGT